MSVLFYGINVTQRNAETLLRDLATTDDAAGDIRVPIE